MALTVRLDDVDKLLVEKLTRITKVPASKSLLIAANFYVNERKKMTNEINQLQDKYENLLAKHNKLIALLKAKEQNSKLINELINQK